MRRILEGDALMRRIDRCYLVASWARAPERREAYLSRAREYRLLLVKAGADKAEPHPA